MRSAQYKKFLSRSWLPLLAACLLAGASGCTWDDSLYTTFVDGDTISEKQFCPSLDYIKIESDDIKNDIYIKCHSDKIEKIKLKYNDINDCDDKEKCKEFKNIDDCKSDPETNALCKKCEDYIKKGVFEHMPKGVDKPGFCPAGYECTEDEKYCSRLKCEGSQTVCSGKCLNFSDLHLSSCTTCASNYCDTDNNKSNGCESYAKGSDPNNCGACGITCKSGEACIDGECSTSCPGGQTVCRGKCVDLISNSNNCGACGNVCPSGQACVDRECTTSCPGGQTVCKVNKDCENSDEMTCENACYDTLSDPKNCGACGNVCPSGQACVDGECTTSCPGGQTVCKVNKDCENSDEMTCENACYDTLSNPKNCGACGNVCPSGQACVDGECTTSCPGGQTVCKVNKDCENSDEMTCENACYDTLSNPKNCGACGNVCPSGQACVDGECTTSCPGGQTVCKVNKDCENSDEMTCENACYDTLSDPKNCGACGNVCPSGQACVDGECTTSCPGGQTVCKVNKDCENSDEMTCENACYDTLSNPKNCGACGNVCPSGQACVDGVCTTRCPGAQVVCGGKCIDPKTDNNYCGATAGNCDNKACPSGQVCTNSTCSTSCLSTQVLCDGKCIDPQSDPKYCGSIGLECEKLVNCTNNNTKKLCSNGSCSSSCTSDTQDCNGKCLNFRDLHLSSCIACETNYCDTDNNKSNGCESYAKVGDSKSTDPNNCGACGTKCNINKVNNSQTVACIDGTCKALTCKSAYHLYDGKCEKDDIINCGAHNQNCSNNQSCINGACSCQNGVLNDNENCGSCNNKCTTNSISHSQTVACVNKQCNALTCQSGYYLNNGKCLNNDNNNCGAPNNKCTNYQICQDGTCKCQSGVLNDNNNCGQCGKNCAPGEVCNEKGACVTSCPSGQIVCGGKCIDPKTDNSYCGATAGNCNNKACDAGKVCNNGNCATSCPTGQTACGNECVNIKTDINHCGGCNNKCTGANVDIAQCITEGTNTSCKILCQSGFGDCTNAQGCETPLNTNQNCGQCGTVCTDGQTCQNGTCQ